MHLSPQVPIEGSASPKEHIAWAFDNMISRCQAEHVVLVGYAYGALLCKEMLARSLAVRPICASCPPPKTLDRL
jgi:hypothetical protein